LKIVFLSRISRKKNLDGALQMLDGIKGDIQFHIYGPQEELDYWEECQKIIDVLPANIQVQYCGSIEHDKTYQVLRDSELFFFPTQGENFGHVIAESFTVGCPVLISDQTPWRDLQKYGVGYDLPLHQPELFKVALQQYVDMDDEAYSFVRDKVTKYCKNVIEDEEVIHMNRELFLCALKDRIS